MLQLDIAGDRQHTLYNTWIANRLAYAGEMDICKMISRTCLLGLLLS